jgi:Ca2+-binding RTX toxin-like protein
MRRLLTLALLTFSAVLCPLAAAHAAPVTCHGVRATQVGASKAILLGTHRRDVIVSNGARQVSTRGGDDLVCITGGGRNVRIVGSEGDETVYVDTSSTQVLFLGRLGSDTYVGSRNSDDVSLRLDGDDRVSTGAGRDIVSFAHAAHRGRVWVSLGRGDDFFSAFAGEFKGLVDGGKGTDGYVLIHRSLRTWVFDNDRGRAKADGAIRFRWRSMERFDVSSFRAPSLNFRGGAGPEQVTQQDLFGGSHEYRFAMGGGDDTVSVASLARGSVDGGDGVDRLDFAVNHPEGLLGIVADLAARSAVVDYANGPDATWTLHGLEQLTATDYPTATLRGDDADNLLIGGAGDDVLAGNGGTDTVDGGAGTDSCDAEVEIDCELP